MELGARTNCSGALTAVLKQESGGILATLNPKHVTWCLVGGGVRGKRDIAEGIGFNHSHNPPEVSQSPRRMSNSCLSTRRQKHANTRMCDTRKLPRWMKSVSVASGTFLCAQLTSLQRHSLSRTRVAHDRYSTRNHGHIRLFPCRNTANLARTDHPFLTKAKFIMYRKRKKHRKS